MHTVAISNGLKKKVVISKMTATLFFDIGAQPYERRRAQPNRNLGVELIPMSSNAHSKWDSNIIIFGSGF